MGGEGSCENWGGGELLVAGIVDRNLRRDEGGSGLLCVTEWRHCEQRRSRGGILLTRVTMTMTTTVLRRMIELLKGLEW